MHSENEKTIQNILDGDKGYRYFVFNSEYVVIEDFKTGMPLLITKKGKLTISMFKTIKQICEVLVGANYSLKVGKVEGHQSISSGKLFVSGTVTII